MVAQDERDVDRQLSRALAKQQVVDAVRCRGGEHQSAQWTTDDIDAMFHVVLCDHRRQCRLEFVAPGWSFDLQSHEKTARVIARELLALGDVATRSNDGATDCVHDAGSVVTHECQNPVRSGSHEFKPRGAAHIRSAGGACSGRAGGW